MVCGIERVAVQPAITWYCPECSHLNYNQCGADGAGVPENVTCRECDMEFRPVMEQHVAISSCTAG